MLAIAPNAVLSLIAEPFSEKIVGCAMFEGHVVVSTKDDELFMLVNDEWKRLVPDEE